jgi:alkylated DNA nucleotide flippase Atl1
LSFGGLSAFMWPMRRYPFYNLIPSAALLFAAGCGGGGSNTVEQPQVQVTIYPAKATVPVGTVQPFTDTVSGTTNTSVNWTTSAGTIDQSGNYTAPASRPSGGTATVTATSASAPSASATVIVTITTTPVTLSISPTNETLKAGFSQLYTATVGGTTNTAVTWSVNGLPGDPSYPGSVLNGTYNAPAPVVTTDTYFVTATSNADPTKSVSASATVTPLENQEQQTFPIKLGASGVNANSQDCCSGTLGSLLQDKNGKQYILSNNHVLGRVGHASAGEAIVQPGYVDAFCNFALPDTVAHFTVAPPIQTSNVDAAIAQVVPGAVDTHGEIIGLGGIASDGSYIPAAPANTMVDAFVGMEVAKSGRTTGLSCGSILAIDGLIVIDLSAECGNPKGISVRFDHQVIAGDIATYGDSGSLIVEAKTARPVALLGGVSNDGTFVTANPVSDVLSELGTTAKNGFTFVGGQQHSVQCPTASYQKTESSNQRVSSPHAQSIASLPRHEISRAIVVEHKYAQTLMQDPAVLGLAVGASATEQARASIWVFVEKGKIPPRLPSTLEDFTVRVVPSGRFTAGIDSSRLPGPRCAPSITDPLDSVQGWSKTRNRKQIDTLMFKLR